MRLFLSILFLPVFFVGCATVPHGDFCAKNLHRPSYFAQGEKRAAFRVNVQAKGYSFDGILQLKRLDDASYEAVLFLTAGAYQVLRATVTRDTITYHFLTKSADRAFVRKKLNTLFHLLLFAEQGTFTCREKEQIRYLTSTEKGTVRYAYERGEQNPYEVSARRMFHTSRLSFAGYGPEGESVLPHQLTYQDGPVVASLQLLLLR